MSVYKNNRIIYIGTPDFAVLALEKLMKKKYKVCCVITQPDKKVGRKQKVAYSPVKNIALKYNIPLLQPQKIKDSGTIKQIKKLKPDIIILAAYGQILSKEILEIPKFGCVNIHASLLPKYRGASPIQYAILKGEKKTGITLMQMGEGLDDGDIIMRKSLMIDNNDNSSILHDKLALLGADLLAEALPLIFKGKIKPISQDEKKATFTKLIKKEDGIINWNDSAQEIERKIRAFYPWPGTFTEFGSKDQKLKTKSKRLKIIKAKILENNFNSSPGTIILTSDKKLAVVCGKDSLILEKVQLEGKKEAAGDDFLRGYPEILNNIFK